MARALLTDGERRHISGESDNDELRYQAVSRVRSRINEKLVEDVEILRKNHPDLFQELQEVVCDS